MSTPIVPAPVAAYPLEGYKDTAALLSAYDNAPAFIKYYDERRTLADNYNVFLLEENETEDDKETVKHWLTNLQNWLVASKDRYDSVKLVAALPRDTINALREAYDRL